MSLMLYIDAYAQHPVKGYIEENQAYIIVTATTYGSNDLYSKTDFSVAKNAKARLTASDGKVIEKETRLFQTNNKITEKPYYSADFKIDLDSTYTIELYINNKAYKIDDYCLRTSWKTHFLYHSTTGSKSPATVFRKQEDTETGVALCIYGVFPYVFYQSLGGSQY